MCQDNQTGTCVACTAWDRGNDLPVHSPKNADSMDFSCAADCGDYYVSVVASSK